MRRVIENMKIQGRSRQRNLLAFVRVSDFLLDLFCGLQKPLREFITLVKWIVWFDNSHTGANTQPFDAESLLCNLPDNVAVAGLPFKFRQKIVSKLQRILTVAQNG